MPIRKIRRGLICICVVSTLGIATFGFAGSVSEQEACDILKQAGIQYHLAVYPASPGIYSCAYDSSLSKSDYFVFGLHYRYHAAAGQVGSNLVGWYAVCRRDGRVFEYDIANLRLGSPLARH